MLGDLENLGQNATIVVGINVVVTILIGVIRWCIL
jgi:hypothetical protein